MIRRDIYVESLAMHNRIAAADAVVGPCHEERAIWHCSNIGIQALPVGGFVNPKHILWFLVDNHRPRAPVWVIESSGDLFLPACDAPRAHPGNHKRPIVPHGHVGCILIALFGKAILVRGDQELVAARSAVGVVEAGVDVLAAAILIVADPRHHEVSVGVCGGSRR